MGRRKELAGLNDIWTSVVNGRPRVALITGEPGAGKTTLMEAFHQRISSNGPSGSIGIARGGCREGTLGAPFGPFAEALRPLLRHSRLDRATTERIHVLTEPDAVDDNTARASRTRLFDAVLGVFSDRDDPSILMIDDLQWIDAASLELLLFLARNLRAEPLLVLLATRTPLPRRLVRAIEELRRNSHLLLMPIGGFSEAETAEAFRLARGVEPSKSEVTQLCEATAGNVFFLEQVLVSSNWVGDLPSAVLPLLELQMEGLRRAAKYAAQILAVAGGRMPEVLFERVLKDDVQWHEEESVELDSSIIIRLTDQLQLRHDLYRRVLMQGLSSPRVRLLHARIAKAAQTLRDEGTQTLSEGEIARHWLASGQQNQILPALARAARDARRTLAFEAAFELWTTLTSRVERVDSPSEEVKRTLMESLSGSAEAAQWLGQADLAVQLTTRALALTTAEDRLNRVEQHGRRATFHRLCGHLEDALWDAERAEELLDSADAAGLWANIVGEHARLVVLSGDVKLGLSLAHQAIDFARQAREPASEGRALSTLGVAEVNSGRLSDGIKSLRAAQRLTATYGGFDDAIRATTNMSYALLQAGHLTEGLAAATEAIEMARRAGVEQIGGMAGVAHDNALVALVSTGRWAEASTRLEERLALTATDPIHQGWLLGTRAQLHAARGRFNDAHADIHALRGMSIQERSVRVGAAAAAAELAYWQSRPEESLAQVTGVLAPEAPAIDRGYLLPWCLRNLGDLADLARHRGDCESLKEIARRADTLMQTFGADLSADTISPVAFTMLKAELGRAKAQLDDSQWGRLAKLCTEQPYERAYALYRQGEAVLGTAEDWHEASVVLGEAFRLTEELDAQPLQSRINQLAKRSAVPIRLPDSTRPSPTTASELGLTPREREVLTYLCLGWTNRKIARTLYISDRTIGVHVSRILTKLGVSNRTAAAAVAQQLGLDVVVAR